MTSSIEIKVEMPHQPYMWYRKSTKEWCISVTFWTNNVSDTLCFASKKKNKAKKQFVKWCMSGILEIEMQERFRNHEIHIEERNYV